MMMQLSSRSSILGHRTGANRVGVHLQLTTPRTAPVARFTSRDSYSTTDPWSAAVRAARELRDFDGRLADGSRAEDKSVKQQQQQTQQAQQQQQTHQTQKKAEPMSPQAAAAAKAKALADLKPIMDELSASERNTVRLFQSASPSVVNVSSAVGPGLRGAPMMFPGMQFPVPRGVGSGFIWTNTGVVVTNAHVVRDSSDVRVTLWDQSTYKAKVVGQDREKDIAVLQLDMAASELGKLQALALGSSDNLLVGQRVYAIGNPFGLDQTLTQGIVSGLGREISARMGVQALSNVIQTDAAINPGNSGGPLLDSKGRVVGINTAILDPTGTGISSGVGFAIPITAVRGLVDQLLRFGRIVRPALGIALAPPTLLKMQGREGVLVMGVQPDGPAAKAGMRGTRRDFWQVELGDIIIGINGQAVREQKDLFAALDDLKVGDNVEVEVVRGASTPVTLRIKLADRDRMSSSE